MAISSLAKSSIRTFDKFNKTSTGTTIPVEQFLATGQSGRVFTSPDGINWTARTTGLPPYGLVAPHRIGNNYYVYDQGYRTRYLSTDGGVTWAKNGQTTGFIGTSSTMSYVKARTNPIDNTTNIFNNTATIQGQFGSMFDVTNATAVGDTEIQGNNWQSWDYATNGSVFLFAGGAAGSAPYLLKSTTTKLGALSAQAYGSSATSFSVCWGAGLFAVSCGNGTGVYTSPDGTTWTSRGQDKRQLQFLNNLFFNYQGNTIARSSNAISWTATTVTGLGGNGINDMAYGAGLYVMVCGGGLIFTSSDGATWTSRTSGTTTAFNNIYYG